MTGKDIADTLTALSDACETISDAGQCLQCPLMATACICEKTDAWYIFEVSSQTLDNFMKFAEECEDYWSDEDCIAYYADEERKAERDELCG